MPIGTLIRKSSASRAPPRRTPPNSSPMRRRPPRSRSRSRRDVARAASRARRVRAVQRPGPAAPRAAIVLRPVGARPQASEATVNSASPTMNTRRRPTHRRSARGEQAARVDDHVAGDHPLQRADRREAQVAPDQRQRHHAARSRRARPTNCAVHQQDRSRPAVAPSVIYIVKGRCPQRVTMKTLADDLGVSPMTVSNAFNRPASCRSTCGSGSCRRAASSGTRARTRSARGLRQGRAGVIGVVSDTPLSYAFDDPAAAAVLGGHLLGGRRATGSGCCWSRRAGPGRSTG